VTDKSCGECTACCGPAFWKVEGLFECFTRCKHALENACGNYDSRPTGCRDFACLWLGIPDWQSELRPDHCGFIVHASADAAVFQLKFIETPTRLVPDSLVRAVATAIAVAKSQGAAPRIRLELATQNRETSVVEFAASDVPADPQGLLSLAMHVIRQWARETRPWGEATQSG
jgi:hypothetical protein